MFARKKILLILLLLVSSISIHSSEWSSSVFPNTMEQQSDKMSIEVLINGASKVKLQGVPTKGYLEVYSILGVRVRNVNIQDCVGGYPLELPKGLYILRAGKVAIKVVAR